MRLGKEKHVTPLEFSCFLHLLGIKCDLIFI